MNLTAENAFIGATVSKGVDTLTVYKVNVKSFYAGKYPLDEFKSMYKFKDKSQTFKDFCKRSSILQYDYSGWEITEEEAAKKQVEEIKSAAKQVFSPSQKKAIKDTFEEYNKNGKQMRLVYIYSSYNSDALRVLIQKDNSLVIRYGDIRYLYNVTSEETIALGEDEALTEDSVPWDRLQSLTA